MKTKGLLIGKFAPLHRGHQSLIEVALSEVDELIIFIYDCPETTNIPLRVRKNWLETLYPKAKVVEIYNGPKILGKTPDIMNLHSNHILENLKKINEDKITHFFSNEFYGEHMGKVLNCINRQVDINKEKYNVSGTLIRNDIEKYKEFVDEMVYKDLLKFKR